MDIDVVKQLAVGYGIWCFVLIPMMWGVIHFISKPGESIGIFGIKYTKRDQEDTTVRDTIVTREVGATFASIGVLGSVFVLVVAGTPAKWEEPLLYQVQQPTIDLEADIQRNAFVQEEVAESLREAIVSTDEVHAKISTNDVEHDANVTINEDGTVTVSLEYLKQIEKDLNNGLGPNNELVRILTEEGVLAAGGLIVKKENIEYETGGPMLKSLMIITFILALITSLIAVRRNPA